MRDVLRSKLKREIAIIAAVAALSGAFFGLARFSEKQAASAGPMLKPWASFEQNLAVLGLNAAEIEAVTTLQEFMDKFPAFAGTDYRQGASYYLSENPQMGERDAFYALAEAAQEKIDKAKGELAHRSRLLGIAAVFLWLALVTPLCYPVYFVSRLLMASRRKK